MKNEPVTLTRRQADALAAARDGFTLAEIGNLLGCHPNTAKFHLRACCRKLGLTHKRELIRVPDSAYTVLP